MKLSIILAGLLFILFSCFLVNALSVNLAEQYEQKETIIFEVRGNILSPIQQSQIEVRRSNTPQQIPLKYEVSQLLGKHFVWIEAPNQTGNYTLFIKDIDTTVQGIRQKINFEQNFSIGENITAYSVFPGFIKARDKFDIEIVSYIDEEIIIPTSYPSEENLVLKPGKNKFTFPLIPIEEQIIADIAIGKYHIPAHLIPNSSYQRNIREGIYFEPAHIKRKIYRSNIPQYTIIITNKENLTYEDLFLQYQNDLLRIVPGDKFTLKPLESKQFNLTLSKGINESIESQIILVYGARESRLEIDLEFEDIEVNTSSQTVFDYYCAELGGEQCSEGTTCSGDTKDSIDGKCCLGFCSIPEEPESNLRWIGWVLAAVIIIILGFVFMKYRKTKQDIRQDKQINQIQQDRQIP